MNYFLLSTLIIGLKNQVINFGNPPYQQMCDYTQSNICDYLSDNIYNYGVKDFGDLQLLSFTFSFFINVKNILQNATYNQYFIAHFEENQIKQFRLYCTYTNPNFNYQISNSTDWIGIIISSQNYWHQVIVQKSHISISTLFMVCDYLQCQQNSYNQIVNPSKIILYQDQSELWYGVAYGATLYKGIGFNFSSNNLFIIQNTMQPEVLIDLNIQEKIQSNITIDYSDYQYIAKLGKQFNWDENDPYLFNNSLLFNNSKFIYVKDASLQEVYTIEFRFNVSSNFTSDIILLNYTYVDKYKLLIQLQKNMSIKIYLNGQYQEFSFIKTQIIHFSLGIIHKHETTNSYFQICFNQYDDTQDIANISQISGFLQDISPFQFIKGKGDLFIGSFLNSFQENQSFQLFHFRLYQGFFYDNKGNIDSQCQFFLNDRCIICNSGYVLQINHRCGGTCDSTTFLTELVLSHNQCLRVCHTNCATCNTKYPSICLQCNGIRIKPPLCRCPGGYFEDGSSPNCIKYYEEIQTQSGFLELMCDQGPIQTDVFYDRPYNSLPSVELILQGAQTDYTSIAIIHVSNLYFSIEFHCLNQFSNIGYIYLQWISSIGNNNFKSVSYENIFLQGNLITQISPSIINYTLYTGFLHLQIYQSIGDFLLKIDNLSESQSYITFSGEIAQINLLYSNFIYYKYSNDSELAEIQLDDIPKSILSINLINGITSIGTFSYNIQQKARSLTSIILQNSYRSNHLKGVLLFATQQCYDLLDSCDFYQSYITSCSLEYSYCNCNEVGYFINSTQQCQCINFFSNQECNSNCRTCINEGVQCTSCSDKFFLNITLNQCINCHHSCQTCSGLQISECQTCAERRFLILNNLCICVPGYYENDINCDACESRCYECINFSSCLSCHKERQFDIATNSCNCPIGQFELQNFQCFNCHPSCKTCNNSLTCLSCFDNRVLKHNICDCPEGYYLDGLDCLSCENGLGIYNKNCKIVNCSDGIWTPYEECDDNNQISKDGCSNCIIDPQYFCINRIFQKSSCYKCQDNCQNCTVLKNQILCDKCNEGYFLNLNQCIKCSKLCSTCQNTSNKCITCLIFPQLPDQNQKCQGCDYGYYINQNSCISICGDGIKILEEDCDDGNQFLGDGCDQKCKIEEGFYCDIIDMVSVCQKIEKPQIYLKQFRQTSNAAFFIQIESTQFVKYSNFSLYVTSDQVEQSYVFNYQYSQNDYNFQILKINLTIVFNSSITNTILSFHLDGDIFNNLKIKLERNYFQQHFQNILVLSDAQNKSSAQLSSSANSQMIVTLTFNCLTLLVSGSSQLSMMLRFNTILSYIKFIDINIPPNFMELLSQLEQFNLFKKIDLFQAYNSIQYGPSIEFEYIDPGPQFNKHGINANFIPNILPFILNLLTGYFFIQILQIQVILLKKLMNHKKKTIKSMSSIFYRTVVFYQVYASKLIKEFKIQGKHQLIESSKYSILFSIFLQLKCQQFSNNIQIINFVLSIGFSLFYLYFTYKRIKSKDSQLKYQGFRPFNFIRSFNPIIYIFSIVFLQSFQLWQLVMIKTSNIVMILSLIRFPYRQIQLNLQNLLEEISLILIFTLFILFIYNPAQIDYIIVGFFQIGFIIFILISNILIQVQINLSFIKQLYLRHQIKLKKQREKLLKNQCQFISLT